MAFRFINLRAARVVHCVECGDGFVYVVGHEDIASYEWVVQIDSQSLLHSDSGYGGAEWALRDGLIVGCGEHDGDPAIETVAGRCDRGGEDACGTKWHGMARSGTDGGIDRRARDGD